jgi:hypothetical protein
MGDLLKRCAELIEDGIFPKDRYDDTKPTGTFIEAAYEFVGQGIAMVDSSSSSKDRSGKERE